MKKIALLPLLIILATFSPLAAQTLSRENCVHLALRSHPDIKRFILQVNRSRTGIALARADYLPQLSLNGEYDPTRTYVFSTNGAFNTKDSDGWQVGATLKQKIWDFSRTSALIKAQKAQQEIANLSLQDAKALLAYKVKLQYDLALIQQQAMVVRKKDLQVKEALYQQAKALVEQGLKTQADATRFLSATSIAKDNQFIAEANFTKANTILSLYIGEPIPPDVEYSDTALLPAPYQAKEESILQHSPLLQSLRKNIAKSDLLYQATKADRFGSIDAVGSYTHQDTLNSYDTTLVGVMLNIPLYSGGRLSAQEEQAIIDRQSAQNEYKAKVLALKEEFATLLIDLRRYDQTIKAKNTQLNAAQQTQEVVNGRYQEGLATYIEVLDATALQLDAKLGLLQARYDRVRTIHRLEYLQGISQ